MNDLIDDSDQLKPCPFCGGQAEIDQVECGLNLGAYYIGCINCNASSALVFALDDIKDILIEKWNKRT